MLNSQVPFVLSTSSQHDEQSTELEWGDLTVVAAVVGSGFLIAQDAPAKAPAEPQHYRAKQVIGAQVAITGEASAGTVDDIVLDEMENVDYLIVAKADSKLITVPWDAAAFDVKKTRRDNQDCSEAYQKIPSCTVKQYPAFTPAYRTQIYKYYGLTPAQERRVIRRGGAVVVP